ncbi:MAG: hypothetical protein ACLQO7_05115 [Candidatus Bathyarchaeia archaeon]
MSESEVLSRLNVSQGTLTKKWVVSQETLRTKLLSTEPARKIGGKMKKPIVALLIFLFVAVVAATFVAGGCLTSNPYELPQTTLTVRSPSLPSPLTVAAWIVGLVAVFGALLSLALRGRHTNQANPKRVGERFWAID